MLIEADYIVKKAVQEKYAIGAFSAYNLETALGVARAAVEEYSPVIIQVSEPTIEYAGLKPITHVVSTIAKNEAISVPVALHLDHGRSFKSVAECIAAGFSSVHIDASDLAFDENVKLTREVVDYARGKNVWVQGELGRIPSSHNNQVDSTEVSLVDPGQVEEFVQKTGVDSLAIAVGTAHGHLREEHLHLEVLKKARAKTDIPLVIHGVSGIPAAEIKQAIEIGANIFSVETAVRTSFCQGIKEKIKADQKISDPRVLLTADIEAVEKETKKWLQFFKSAGQAER